MSTQIAYPFSADRVHQGCGNEAMRQAVLWPLAARYLRSRAKKLNVAYERPGIAAAYEGLQALWRARIQVLAIAGWTPALKTPGHDRRDKADYAHSAAYRYVCLSNCPPFGVRVPRAKGHFCTRARICPMCYARRVTLELYKSTAFAFYLDNPNRVLQRVGLLACVRTFTVHLSERGPDGWVQRANQKRFTESDLVPLARGSAVLTTLEPGDKEGVTIRVRRSTILMVPSLFDATQLRAVGDVQHIEPKQVTKETIGKLVAFATVYPLGMMFGNPRVASELYEAATAKRLKMFTTSGLLRNNQARADAFATTADAGELG